MAESLHGERAQGAGVRPDEAADWVRAADAEINDDLVPAGLDLPGNPVLPRDLRADDGLLAEQYFDAIRRRAAADPRWGGGGADNQARSGPWLDCGSGADGIPRPGQGTGGLAASRGRLRSPGHPRRPVTTGVNPGHANTAGRFSSHIPGEPLITRCHCQEPRQPARVPAVIIGRSPGGARFGGSG